jgi:hypothetical protein
MIIVTILALVAALTAGMVANRRVRPFAKTEVQGVKLELLVSPLLTLTVLLLSFVLVQAFGSFHRVRVAESTEAGRIDTEYDMAGYFPEESAVPIRASLVCYARAVVDIEWPALADGVALHPVPTRWSSEIDPVFASLSATGDTDQPYGTILTVDKERTDARRLRITEAEPAVPSAVTALMLIISAAAVFAIAAFTLPYVSRSVQLGALAVMVVVFSAMQITIHEIDRQFEGVITVQPTDLQIARQQVEQDFADDHPDEQLACDTSGHPS